MKTERGGTVEGERRMVVVVRPGGAGVLTELKVMWPKPQSTLHCLAIAQS